MSLHVQIERIGVWYAARLLEDDSCYSQGKTLEEVVDNIREVIELVRGEKKPELEVIIPSNLKLKSRTTRSAKSKTL